MKRVQASNGHSHTGEHRGTSAKINISYSILFNLTTSYASYFGGKKGISRNKTSLFLLMYGYGHEAGVCTWHVGVCTWCMTVGHVYYKVIGVHMSLYTVGLL